MQEQVEGEFRQGTVACGASRLQWRAAGSGDAVVDLGTGTTWTRFHGLLAKRFAVVTLQHPAAGDMAEALGELAAATGKERFSLIVRGTALTRATQVLRARPGLVEAMVLLAPVPGDDAAAIEALAAAGLPLLVLSGTRGIASPPEAGSRFRARLRNCHYVLVYDAGDSIETDRPEASASVVGEFLTRRERFIVAHADGLIHP